MTNIAARKQARRFFGTMGVAMRRLACARHAPQRAHRPTIRRPHGYPGNRIRRMPRELMAR